MGEKQTNETERGMVLADGLYTLPEIQRRLGLGTAAMRTARQQGLRVLRHARRGFVRGKDVIEFLGRIDSGGEEGK